MHPFPLSASCFLMQNDKLSYLKYKQIFPTLYKKVINFSRKYIYLIREEFVLDNCQGFGGIDGIILICVLILLMGAVKQKTQWIFILLLRSVAGVVGISVVNSLLESQGIAMSAGINPVSVLTIGTLGICGFALVYGILLYQLL